MKLFNIKNLLIILIICCSIKIYLQVCKEEQGCVHKDKFVTWAPPVDIYGKTSKEFKNLNFHKVLVLHNGLSIIDSGNPDKRLIEKDPSNPNYGMNASTIARRISWSQIILDCGKYRNKLCSVGDYPDQDRLLKAKSQLTDKRYGRLESHCIVIPFFDDIYYENEDEKLVLFCLPNNAKDIYDILKYKEYLSRKIENIQIAEVGITETQFNHINRPKRKYLTFDKENRSIPVNLQIKFNYLVLWSDKFTYIKKYSLLEQEIDGFATSVRKALDSPKSEALVKGWDNHLAVKPSPNCCLFMKGTFNNLLACVAKEGEPDDLETTNQERCEADIITVTKEIHDFIYKAKYEYAYNQIINKIDTIKCNESPWNVMKNRYLAAAQNALENCKAMFLYSEDSNDSKKSHCMTSYFELLAKEIMFLTKKNVALESKFEECVENGGDRVKKLKETPALLEKIKAFSTTNFFFKQVSGNHHDKVYDIQEVEN